MKRVLLQVADTGPLESLVVMMRSAGYECLVPNDGLRRELSELGGLVLSSEHLQRSMGYAAPMHIQSTGSMDGVDLYVDVKAHQIRHKFQRRYGKPILWYRINGGRPEHVPGRGDEINPGCPVVTPNQWYKDRSDAYVFWPQYVRHNDHVTERPTRFELPICLIHNINGWGYQDLIPAMKSLGVRMYGRGSPDGLIQHRDVASRLKYAVAMVHLKSSDAPGYALLEAMASACPIICTRRLMWRCRMQELLIPGETCLVFDRETHEGLTAADVTNCTMEVSKHLQQLRDPQYNRYIGENGRRKLHELMWRDDGSFKTWMERHFQ